MIYVTSIESHVGCEAEAEHPLARSIQDLAIEVGCKTQPTGKVAPPEV